MFTLRVQQWKQDCLFELSWGKSQRLTATLPFPESLNARYQEWRQAYFNFYSQSYRAPVLPTPTTHPLRGRAAGSGSVAPVSIDWQARLVEAELRLLYDFHRWLRSPELYDIQTTIVAASRTLPAPHHTVDLSLTCDPMELVRLPWESWEMGGDRGKIRISRSPSNIRHEAVEPSQGRRSRPRILVIVGYDPGQNFQADWATVKRSLHHLAEIPDPVGYQPGLAVGELKTRIRQAIADPLGWDLLIFAGHSNETQISGGELGIAPGVSIQIREIEEALAIAKHNGLQFAMFNSCNGLSIAESLIDLGINQVAVMREPIHSDVAQAFLIQFLQGLAAHQDVHDALITTCHSFKTEANLTYPSAHLVPSLFSYPGVAPFRLNPMGWRTTLKHLRPKLHELAALALLVPLSLLTPVQTALLEQRVLVQAIYRDLTHQTPARSPDLLLVQINDQSLIEGGIGNPQPMDRAYLARLVNQVAAMDAPVLGIDFVLDRPLADQDPILATALQNTLARYDTRLVFAAFRNPERQWLKTYPAIIDPVAHWHGDITLWNAGRSMTLLPSDDRPLPFAYLLALAHTLHAEPGDSSQAIAHHEQPTDLVPYLVSERMRPSPLTRFSYRLKQVWLRPIVDFSIPPATVYATIPAWQLLNTPPPQLRQDYPQSVIVIAPGGYSLGTESFGQDQFRVPAAMRYWWQQTPRVQNRTSITGAELHAYLFDHFAHDRLLVPIPDLWMLGGAILVGKGMVLLSLRWGDRKQWAGVVAIAITVYGGLSLQLYVSAALVLPWSLPTLLTLIYGVPALIRKNRDA